MREVIKLVLKDLENNIELYEAHKITLTPSLLGWRWPEQLIITAGRSDHPISSINTGSKMSFMGGKILTQNGLIPSSRESINLSVLESFIIRTKYLKLKRKQQLTEECNLEDEGIFNAFLKIWLVCRSFKFNSLKKDLPEESDI